MSGAFGYYIKAVEVSVVVRQEARRAEYDELIEYVEHL